MRREARNRDTELRWVALVARREMRERLRSRGFLAATTIGIVLAAVAVTGGLLGGARPATRFAVAFAGHSDDLVLVAARDQAPAFGARLSVSRASPATATSEVASGAVDAALVDGRIAIARGSGAGRLLALLQSASQRVAALAALSRPSVSAAKRNAALHHLPVRFQVIHPASPAAAAVRIAVPGEVLLLLLYCSFITTGVVEEKLTRVVEVVLGAISARALLAGKVIGVAVLALGQLVLLELSGVAATALIGVHFSHVAVLDLLLVPGGVALGFAFYGCLYAAAGALASPSGDARAGQLPLTVLLLASMLVGETQAASLSSGAVQVLSLLPPLSPVLLPARLSAGAISGPELAIGLGLSLVSAVVLIRLAARAYGASILGLRGRGGLREALRSPA